eukprot:scaffold46561_cov22-Tisochrysis_lutea.AAC.2
MRAALEQERAVNKQLKHALTQLQHAVRSQKQVGGGINDGLPRLHVQRDPQSVGTSGSSILGTTPDIEQWEE